MSLSLRGGSGVKGPFQWRLNETLLSNPTHCSILDKALSDYFSENDTGSVSPGCLWAAHKAVMRGRLLQLSSQLKKESRAEVLRLTADFRLLSKAHKHHPTPDNLAKLDSARVKPNLSLTTSTEKHLRWSGARFYYQSDKIGAKLAAKLSPRIRTSVFPKIRASLGNLTQNPTIIMKSFHDFYSHLYEKVPHTHCKARELFLRDINLPHLQQTHRDLLDAPFSSEEILDIIKSLKTNSAPGPDGFSVCYYKKFGPRLAPPLARFFNSLRDGAPLPSDLNSAFISVIPKQGKDPSEVSSYRPISLINNDLKIMTKILANRMSNFIANYIHRDQVGFIPGRQGPDQVRRAIDLISLLQSKWDGGPAQKGFLLSLDLQKAFDSVSWPYLFDILERCGFGDGFRTIIHTLYSSPSAQVQLMGHYSEPFNIRRGTRQGCPLSPLIFAIAIETLAIAIRSNENIKGVKCGPDIHKCALFADDMLLFLTAPLISTPNVFRLLRDFGVVSGLQVNVTKSMALNVSVPGPLIDQLQQHFPFTWAGNSIPYLGIKLTKNIGDLYAANYPPCSAL